MIVLCQYLKAIGERDGRFPIQGVAGLCLVEPVSGRELLCGKAGHGRFVLSSSGIPDLFDESASGDGELARHKTRGPLNARRFGDTGEEFVNRAGFAIRNNKGASTKPRRLVECCNQCPGGVVDPGGVDEGEPGADERKAALLGPF